MVPECRFYPLGEIRGTQQPRTAWEGIVSTMAPLGTSKPQLYNALIVSPDSDLRARLKLAVHHDQTLGSRTFDKVHACSSLEEAVIHLADDPRFDVVLIPDNYEQSKIESFMERLKTFQNEKYGLVLVLRGSFEDKASLADKFMSGIDGCLCEPFSVESLGEITRIAERVRKENEDARISSAAGLVIESALDEIDFKCAEQSEKKRENFFSTALRRAIGIFRNLSPERRDDYYDTLMKAVDKRTPAPPQAAAPDGDGYTGPSEIIKKRLEAKKASEEHNSNEE